MVMQGYCGAIITIIQTSTGEIVAPIQRLLYDPGRSATSTYVSTDDGASWANSNTIDLGGHGPPRRRLRGHARRAQGRASADAHTHHVGPLSGRAYSGDKGRSWLEFRPTDIDASKRPRLFGPALQWAACPGLE